MKKTTTEKSAAKSTHKREQLTFGEFRARGSEREKPPKQQLLRIEKKDAKIDTKLIGRGCAKSGKKRITWKDIKAALREFKTVMEEIQWWQSFIGRVIGWIIRIAEFFQ